MARTDFIIILIGSIPFFGTLAGIRPTEAAEWTIVPEIRSASVYAGANQTFGAGVGKVKEASLSVPAMFPEKLETSVADHAGNEREAAGRVGLEMDDGKVRIVGKISAKDSDPNDFIAPITTVKGRVKFDLKVMLSDDSERLTGTLRLTGEGSPSLTGEEGKTPPANILLQVWLNDQPLLQPSHFLIGAEKKISRPLQNGDILTFLFQADFSLFSTGEAEIASTLHYTFER